MVYLHTRALIRVLAALSAATLLALAIVVLFEPGLAYEVRTAVPPARSTAFLDLLSSAIEQAPMKPGETALFSDGVTFYPAELKLIQGAKNSIHLEAFIFHATPIGQRFLDALVEKARAGVQVRVVVDAVGSLPTPNHFFDPLRAAGGQVAWYQPFHWLTLKRWNNRTHREMLIVDGATAFIGGAGIGTAWDTGTGALPPWRDLMVRVDGAPARGLQSVFAHSWLESSGEILLGLHLWMPTSVAHKNETFTEEHSVALVVGSTPTGGRATRARIMYQLLVGASRDTLLIDSPYFIPDRSMRQALLEAVVRGVHVTILTPGEYNNHPFARLASRRHYGELIAGGVDIYEYAPGMIHSKILLVDGIWSVVGSTNFDNRSFGLNNEVNLILRDPAFAAKLNRTVNSYLAQSRKMSLAEWSKRPLVERSLAAIGSVLERQE